MLRVHSARQMHIFTPKTDDNDRLIVGKTCAKWPFRNRNLITFNRNYADLGVATGTYAFCGVLQRKDLIMKSMNKIIAAAMFATASLTLPAMTTAANAATSEDLNKDSRQALENLYDTNETAKLLSKSAKAILVFPNVVKAGLVFGGAYGEGTLMKNGAVVDYYNSVTGSWGLQAGAQSYGYVVFLMTDAAVKYLDETSGFEIGVGPTVVLVDEGVAKNLSTSTLKDDAYAFVFNQQGLMAGVSIEGTKISKIKR